MLFNSASMSLDDSFIEYTSNDREFSYHKKNAFIHALISQILQCEVQFPTTYPKFSTVPPLHKFSIFIESTFFFNLFV